jgi:hypothetical protein
LVPLLPTNRIKDSREVVDQSEEVLHIEDGLQVDIEVL